VGTGHVVFEGSAGAGPTRTARAVGDAHGSSCSPDYNPPLVDRRPDCHHRGVLGRDGPELVSRRASPGGPDPRRALPHPRRSTPARPSPVGVAGFPESAVNVDHKNVPDPGVTLAPIENAGVPVAGPVMAARIVPVRPAPGAHAARGASSGGARVRKTPVATRRARVPPRRPAYALWEAVEPGFRDRFRARLVVRSPPEGLPGQACGHRGSPRSRPWRPLTEADRPRFSRALRELLRTRPGLFPQVRVVLGYLLGTRPRGPSCSLRRWTSIGLTRLQCSTGRLRERSRSQERVGETVGTGASGGSAPRSFSRGATEALYTPPVSPPEAPEPAMAPWQGVQAPRFDRPAG
jgi:hypothetical protein